MTKIIHVSEIDEYFDEIICVFTNGGVVLYPTDTQYALGVLATSEEGTKKINTIKKITTNKPVSVVVSDMEMVERYVYVNDEARILMEKYLPGPLTLILPAKDNELAQNMGNENKIGIRIPDRGDILRIVKELSLPVTATSANISGQVPDVDCRSILSGLEGIDLAIDGGDLKGKPSTIVEFSGSDFSIIRKGVLDLSELE